MRTPKGADVPTHQFNLAYADYNITPERAAPFCDELIEELLDHQPTVEWQRVTDVGGGRFYAALRVSGDEREAAAVLTKSMENARARLRGAAR